MVTDEDEKPDFSSERKREPEPGNNDTKSEQDLRFNYTSRSDMEKQSKRSRSS